MAENGNSNVLTQGPVNEIGSLTGSRNGLRGPGGALGALGRFGFPPETEYVPDLKWPKSRLVYHQMRADSQAHGLWLGMTLPIRRYTYSLEPNGAPMRAVKELSEDLRVPIAGREHRNLGRRAKRFSHDEHLYHALLAMWYGFMFFEQVGEIVDGKWRLRKLAPRLPSTIQEIRISKEDGGLEGIRQTGIQEMIPVNRLVAYVWDKEGANWYGRSMFRPVYRDWFLKDQLVRANTIAHKRFGPGVPVAKATSPDTTPAEMRAAQKVAEAWTSGERAHAALPFGVDIEIKAAAGGMDTIGSIRYHDEQMARALLMMFMQLGQTETGSRALGESFISFFSLAQQAVADWYLDVFNEHVIEDWMDWNYGGEANAPQLTYEIGEEEETMSTEVLERLISIKAVVVDDELREWVRERYRLPEPGGEAVEEPEPVPEPPEADEDARSKEGAGSPENADESASARGRRTRSARGRTSRPGRPSEGSE